MSAIDSSSLPRTGSGSTGKVILGLSALGILLGAAFLAGFVPRSRQAEELRRDVEDSRTAIPEVKVARVVRASAETTLTLPGSARAFLEAPLYARINGYLKRFLVDLGDGVTKGQLMAEIESPEVDQQLRQARANLTVARASLVQSRANLTLAQAAAKRWSALAKDRAVSQQEADEKQSAYEARQADVQAAEAAILSQEANVKRYEELQAFEQITAPFDGIVTSRSVDVGTLVTEGSSTSARELFRVVQSDKLRVFVNVPESAIASVRPGLGVQVRFDAHPGRVWEGTVSRTARAADPSARTMQSEVSVLNPDGVLSSGLYAQVTFQLKRQTPPLLVPANALVIWPKGVFVAVVGADSVVRYPSVQVGRDYGSRAEILSGLREGDRVMLNPSTEIREGQKVRAVDEQ
jgi:RND family efflux transporter MFP subunit